MTKPSLIHPVLKSALQSLDLEANQEIARYHQSKSHFSPQDSSGKIVKTSSLSLKQPQEIPDGQQTVILEAETITSPQENIPSGLLQSFTTPWGLASIVLTTIGSSLLGWANMPQNLPQPQPGAVNADSTPGIVEGLDLSRKTLLLNFKNLSRLPK